MATYDYPNDGKFHTRYSELAACQTPAGAIRIAKQRLGLAERVETKQMAFGTLRHDMWEREARETGLSPECFLNAVNKRWGVFETENGRATELFEGIVIHFTTDLIGLDEHSAVTEEEDGTRKAHGAVVIDYKTATEMNTQKHKQYYMGMLQLPTYKLLLAPHGINIREGHYLLECWDRERKTLKGYVHIVKPVGLKELAAAKAMLRKGVENLIAAEAMLKKQHNL